MNDVTKFLQQLEAGESQARDALFEAIYFELRQMAAAQLAQEQPGQTLQPTALVHEVWLRLMRKPVNTSSLAIPCSGEVQSGSRRYFFAAAAEAMRRILIERARARRTQKRGKGRQKVDLEMISVSQDATLDQVLDVDTALKQLALVEPQAAELVSLRYFAGFTVEEASEILGLSLRGTHRLWGYAKAWLYDALHDAEEKTGE